jgi:N-acetylneuraminate synthase/N,N'-diacetyllegionaminate synthase
VTLPTAAVALGADMIEKHLTLDRTLPGPDHYASLEPDEFGILVASARAVEAARGSGLKEPVAAELPIAAVARKSLHWNGDLAGGETITDGDLVALRPGTGMPPSRIDTLVGRRLARSVAAGSAVDPEDLTPER